MQTIHDLIASFQLQFGVSEQWFFGAFLAFIFCILIALRLGKIYVFALMAVLSVLMNIFVVKPFKVFGITTYGGNEMYGAVCLAEDVINEYYGRKEALKGVRIGFFILFVYFFSSLVLVNIPPDIAVENAQAIQSAFAVIFTPAIGIVIASISAYFISNTLDAYIYDFLHKKTGKYLLWLRSNVSTIISQFVDTVIFSYIAVYFGIFTLDVVWQVIIFAYFFKLIIALLETPFLYLSKVFVKKNDKEGFWDIFKPLKQRLLGR